MRVTFIPDESDLTQTTARVIQQNSYYPYGMPMYGDATNDLHLAFASGEKSMYLYSGKELYDQGDLNWFDHGSRMYDPATGRWSAMDPAAQFANPYLAMGNNPVVFVDPNGEFAFIPALLLLGKAVAIGAGMGAVSYTASVAFSEGGFDNWNWGSFGRSVGIGAASAAVSFGIGSAAGAIGGIGGFAFQTIGHAAWGGVNSRLNGGDFWSGALSGAVGNVVGSATAGTSPAARIFISAFMGGGWDRLCLEVIFGEEQL